MAEARTSAGERRAERRIPLVARVRIAPRDEAPGVVGKLVDVSAGGLRAACAEAGSLGAGATVDVEITVRDPRDVHHAPLVNLRGGAVIVRVEAPRSDETSQVALRFVGPLTLREPFSQMMLF